MGCKTSAIRTDSTCGSCVPADHRESPAPSPSKAQAAHNSSPASAGPVSETSQQDRSEQPGPAAPDMRKSSRSSMPASPRHSSADVLNDNSLHRQQQQVSYSQDDDPFAPPPPLPPELATKSDSLLTTHAGTSSSDRDDSGDEHDGGGEGVRHLENHFDPVPMSATVPVDNQRPDSRDKTPPRLPSADLRTISKGGSGTFRTSISEHDKTDAVQAAKEYQQRMEAKRNAEEVHTKRRRLEEFDPVRPVDSFNVTHRGLLGRCWDRRAPELIPVSFVHTIAKMIVQEDSHPVSTPTISHASGGDEYPPGSPLQRLSRLSRQSGPRGGTVGNGAAAATAVPPARWTGVGGRRVPRRSHWFSVGGVSTDGLAPARLSSPATVEPFYVKSTPSTPTVSRPSASGSGPGAFPATLMVGGGAAMQDFPSHVLLNSAAAEAAKASPKRTAAASSAEIESSAEDTLHSATTKTLTTKQVMALPWETREKYYNLTITRNPRYMGIKDSYAFKLGSGVSNDRSVKFLRKRNLEPATGVTAMRWNRVEFFHPSLHTFVRAVAKTQGTSLELSQLEQASINAADGAAFTDNDANLNELGLCGNGSVNSRAPTGERGLASTDNGDVGSPDLLRRSFSQFLMGHVENCSFTRVGGDGVWGGGDRRSRNGSFLSNTNVISPQMCTDKSTVSTSVNDKPLERLGLWGGGVFFMDAHRNRAKEAETRSPAVTPPFPEDSVLALALSMPYSRLGQLAGVPAAVRSAALSNARRLSGHLLHSLTVGLGSRKTSRDTINSTGGNASAPPRSSGGFAAVRPAAQSVLVALSVSSFTVSIDPFEWQERRYMRYPVDIDGSKRSSRSSYGEGVITDVMYGGLMVVECSSMEAVRELQVLLGSMTWTEERSLRGIVKDVRKHLKTVHNNLHKSRLAAARRLTETSSNLAGGRSGTEEAAAATDWNVHRYRIIRRIGGRPMRDAVELEEISVFFDEDEEVREERTTLHQPDQNKKVPLTQQNPSSSRTTAGAATAGVNRGKNVSLPSLGLDSLPAESGPSNAHSSPNGPDPDITSSFSRVASAWYCLPVISAVLRTWGLHLLACPEYAQPTAMFLQKHAGLAPVLQLTALAGFYHEDSTPSDEDDVVKDADYLFFECDGPACDEPRRLHGAAVNHPQPTPRIPKFNRFYAPLPVSPHDGGHDQETEKLAQAYTHANNARAAKGQGVKEQRKAAPPTPKPNGDGNKPPAAAAAASSSLMVKASNSTLADVPSTQQQQTYNEGSGTGQGRLRVRRSTQSDHYRDEDEIDTTLGPKSHSKETLEGEGGAQMADSQNHGGSPLTSARQSTAIMSFSDSGKEPAGGQQQGEKERKAGAKRSTPKTSPAGFGFVRPKRVDATRPSSPLSPGSMTVPQSRRHNDRRRVSSLTSSSMSSLSSSFFAVSSDTNVRHSTIVFQPNNSSIPGSGGVTERPSAANSVRELERRTAASMLSERASGHRFTTAVSTSTVAGSTAAPVVAGGTPPRTAPTSTDDLPDSSHGRSTPTILSQSGSPRLFMPTPRLSEGNPRDTGSFEIVAMARTVGPGESLAAQEAQRKANASTQLSHSLLGHRGSSSTRSTNVASGSGGAVAAPPTPPGTVVVTATSDNGGDGKKVKAQTRKAKKATGGADGKASSASLSSTKKGGMTVIVKHRGSANNPPPPPTTAMVGATPLELKKPPLLPLALAPGGCAAEESQMQPLGTPTGAAGHPRAPGTPTGFAFRTSAFLSAPPPSGSVAVAPTPPHVSEEEAEGLWYMTMLEVKAQRQELEDLRSARRNAEDHAQRRQEELRALTRVFLPHTHPQDLDSTLLYLKTVLLEPEDLPHGRLFLQQQDWLPLLAVVWTSPMNRIRSVEIAAELTWVDIPRLGLISGLLYHHNASSPLEEFIIRSDKLLGDSGRLLAAKSGDGTSTTTTTTGGGGGGLLAKAKRRRAKRRELSGSIDVRNTSLNFVTELDGVGGGFGPGCPPFFIAPEEARDTLWLLLCAVATNTATPNFRVVLRGIPTPATASTGDAGGGGAADHERAPSGLFASFFGARRRDERGDEPLLLRPESMLLDSFVVQPTLHDDKDSKDGGSNLGSLSPVKVSSGELHNNFDDVGLLSVTANSCDLHSPGNFRQASSLIIVTNSLGNPASQDPLGRDDACASFSPHRLHKRSLSTTPAVRTINGPGRGSPLPKSVVVVVPTHQHHVRRRPWVHDGIVVEERPFYEVLLHRCAPLEEARLAAAAAAASSDAPSPSSTVATPYISHYHHPYNSIHNDARFYVSGERRARLQTAVKRAVAVANGEVSPQDADKKDAVYSSKPKQPKQQQSPADQLRQQASSESTRTPSPPPAVPVPCPPPLPFCETSMAFGLESAEEEARVLFYEERQLRDRAADIWEALRKSVKHYNQAQQEARHKAMKGRAKNASPPPPMHLITLEY
ncbi:hypothetical protein ABB37_06775 [Leptomonas pyrrhocoris]|uniref:Uncharacterized protein n=1 Tax=Leptomonas pyrrhocoris TaxID=157538 RepID=A0A0N0DTW6_LEPPY|nr:hypothetical protein ABB37_06775 [Leptomonas pyrrhocoris]XP_015656461.1 hypothetical protein ABB37_06775 [Leptomonas pyrrhocoris]KPA78021.1 hypothetical protein ABB37_06775 [Leptomonas pyrrhocoris]KPA78022.1 hypothetical protein ABB37_06775 [Leptomonas pyrrhocoris]|eukprot:XP_015656460.1 hypothetical protein ABB37_06775 [Leptomonas pyrrhocoris]